MPSWRLTTGGLKKTRNFSPRGAPLRSTSATSSSISFSASSAGLAMVAELMMNTGRVP